jgi:hypothetical protein
VKEVADVAAGDDASYADCSDRGENLYGGAEPLYTDSDGSTVIDGHGPTLQVWSVHD